VLVVVSFVKRAGRAEAIDVGLAGEEMVEIGEVWAIIADAVVSWPDVFSVPCLGIRDSATDKRGEASTALATRGGRDVGWAVERAETRIDGMAKCTALAAKVRWSLVGGVSGTVGRVGGVG
jgi:hypothetical protein